MAWQSRQNIIRSHSASPRPTPSPCSARAMEVASSTARGSFAASGRSRTRSWPSPTTTTFASGMTCPTHPRASRPGLRSTSSTPPTTPSGVKQISQPPIGGGPWPPQPSQPCARPYATTSGFPHSWRRMASIPATTSPTTVRPSARCIHSLGRCRALTTWAIVPRSRGARAWSTRSDSPRSSCGPSQGRRIHPSTLHSWGTTCGATSSRSTSRATP
mmetsp:Transcript_20499/g.55173  ORF Transcript_20499/g.55173 Transcript_20499/m.55173 type:complete len:216 (+) Transcript_20499:224-871(+)